MHNNAVAWENEIEFLTNHTILFFLDKAIRDVQKELGLRIDLRDQFFRPLAERYTSLQLSGDPLWYAKFIALPEFKEAMLQWDAEVKKLPSELRALEWARDGASSFLGPL